MSSILGVAAVLTAVAPFGAAGVVAEDTETLAPILTSPAQNSRTKGSVAVSFTLPENAAPGSVKLSIGTVVLTLAGTQELAGPHSFNIDPTDLDAAPEVASATADSIEDGSYTVTLTYQDVAANAAASDDNTGVALDNSTSAPELIAPAASTVYDGDVSVSFNLPENAASGTVKLSFGGIELVLAASEETQGAHSFTFNPENPTSNPKIVSGSPIPDGTYGVSLSYRDDLQNAAANDVSTAVTVDGPSGPLFSELFVKGGAVPGAGVDARIQAGALWTSFGSPVINESGVVAFVGKWRSPAVTTPVAKPAQNGVGIFVDGVLVVKAGEDVVGLTDITYKAFRDPVLDGTGKAAFLATITGTGVNRDSDTVLAYQSVAGAVNLIAREGGAAPGTGGASFKSFTSVSAKGSTPRGLLFTGTLVQGNTSTPATTTSNDSAAWFVPADASAPSLAIREGAPGFKPDETVRSLAVLRAAAGSSGHGRGQLDGNAAVIQVGLSSGRQAIVKLVDGAPAEVVSISGGLVGGIALAEWSRLGYPSIGSNELHDSVAVLGGMKAGVGAVTSANAKGIFVKNIDAASWTSVIRTNEAAPGVALSQFKSFRDPIRSADGTGTAFLGTFAGTEAAAAITVANNEGLWWAVDGEATKLIVREGGDAPAPAGAKWKSITSVSLPGQNLGPVFTARLQAATKAVPTAPGGVTSADDVGLYATDEEGSVFELVRESQLLRGKKVKSFSVLKPTSGNAGAGRSLNEDGSLVLSVTYTNGTTAIVRVNLPVVTPPIPE